MNYKLAAAALLAPNCSGANKLALQGFALLAEENGICIVSPAAIAKTIGVNRSTICRAIDTLKEVGYLADADNGYKVSVPALSESNQDVARCNKYVASRNNDSVAVCNNVASRNKIEGLDVASRNNPPAEESTPHNSASLPPTPPITSNILVTPLKEENGTILLGKAKGGMGENALPPESSLSFLAEVGCDALECLCREGMENTEAKKRIAAVKDAFKSRAYALEANGWAKENGEEIRNPKKFLTATLVSMAKEGTKNQLPVQAEPEPRNLSGILKRVADYYKTVYSDQASRITGESILESLPPRTCDTLQAMEAEHWTGIASPVAKVKAILQPFVYRMIQAAREDDYKSASSALVRISNSLAQRKWYLKELCDNNAPAAAIDAAKAKVKDLEAKVAEVKSRIKALDAIKEAA